MRANVRKGGNTPKPPAFYDGLSDRLVRNVRCACVRAGMKSLNDLAQSCGEFGVMSPQNFRKRMIGEYRWFLDDIDRMAGVLGIDAVQLIAGTPDDILPDGMAEMLRRAATPTDADALDEDDRRSAARLLALGLLKVNNQKAGRKRRRTLLTGDVLLVA